MNTNIDKLVKELETIYENSCFKKSIEVGNKNCLALDEQELAIIRMCVECLASQKGIDIDNYVSNGLFILLKHRDLGSSACTKDRVKAQPVKYKKYYIKSDYLLDNMTQLLFVYYAVLLLYANDENTGVYNKESRRHYFKVYAYFACICPKTFNTLFFNQLHLFMSNVNKQLPLEELREYLRYTDELWEEYRVLMSNNRRIEISEEVITQFSEIMSYDENVFFNNMIQMQNMSEDDFLAFDFMGGDTLRGYRFKTILTGIEYFQWYLEYLKDKIQEQSFNENDLIKMIDNILESSKELKHIFEDLLKAEGNDIPQFERTFDNVYELLIQFEAYCTERVKVVNV